MKGARLQHASKNMRLLRLKVDGLGEGRPSILRGDTVRIIDRGKCHTGYAHTIELNSVLISLSEKFVCTYQNDHRVNVELTASRTLLRIQHQALSDDMCDADAPLILPTPETCSGALRTTLLDEHWLNDSLNREQKQAVENILGGESRPAPYVIFGPPGTGKTVTLIETLAQAAKRFPNQRILACAPSNDAANIIARGLIQQHMTAKEVVRLNAFTRSRDQTPRAIWPFCRFNEDGVASLPSCQELGTFRIVICTLATAAKLPFQLGIKRGFFDMIAVDEAGQSFESEVVSVASLMLDPENGGQLVLCGDPKQLGPIVHSDSAKALGMGMSFLERLTGTCPLYLRNQNIQGQPAQPPPSGGRTQVLTKLVNNYRSHPQILELPNLLFYNNELVPCVNPSNQSTLSNWEHAPNTSCPLIFCGVEGRDIREGNSPSWFNIHEIEKVRHYVLLLLESKTLNEQDIGIIAPYQKQVQKIKAMLRKLNIPNRDGSKIVVGSTEQFQGEEKRVIIISTVRASNEFVKSYDAEYQMGFLSDPKRFNVAITRAKELLITIGHPELLWSDIHWRKFLRLCREKGALAGVAPPAEDYYEGDQLSSGNGASLAEAMGRMTNDSVAPATSLKARFNRVWQRTKTLWKKKDSRDCHVCGEKGHLRHDCPKAHVAALQQARITSTKAEHARVRQPRGKQSRERQAHDKQTKSEKGSCHICGEKGHIKRECLQANPVSNTTNKKCHICGVIGHLMQNCPQAKSKNNLGCHICGVVGHKKRDCPQATTRRQRQGRRVGVAPPVTHAPQGSHVSPASHDSQAHAPAPTHDLARGAPHESHTGTHTGTVAGTHTGTDHVHLSTGGDSVLVAAPKGGHKKNKKKKKKDEDGKKKKEKCAIS